MQLKSFVKYFSLYVYFFSNTPLLHADEGMWPLPDLNELIADSLKKKGLVLEINDIFDLKAPSISDAVVIFGNGCTGEMVSEKGLLFTNHHCAYEAIQKLSTLENDYLSDGFWALNEANEIHCKGLTVSFLEEYLDISDSIIPFLNDAMTEKSRQAVIDSIALDIKLNHSCFNKNGYEFLIKEFFGGNKFYLVVNKIFFDVRLVGAPPTSIGKFGADTDNWMWPRHTGDFAVFRVYGDSIGNPATYSKSNIAIKPKNYLSISLNGYKENDFAMVIGYPGSTKRYLTAAEVSEITNVINPVRIKTRGVRQEIIMKEMEADKKVRIQYASKYARSSNYWKYSIGQNKGIKRLKVIGRKKNEEIAFNQWQKEWGIANGNLGVTDTITKIIENRKLYTKGIYLYNEAFIRGIEAILLARQFAILYSYLRAPQTDKNTLNDEIDKLFNSTQTFFKDYNVKADKKVAVAMLKLLSDELNDSDKFKTLIKIEKKGSKAFEKYVFKMYSNSIFSDSAKLLQFLKNPSKKKLEADPIFKLALEGTRKYYDVYNGYNAASDYLNKAQRNYVKGLVEMKLPLAAYPDANFTMRLSYGQIKGYRPSDAVEYKYFTNLSGVIEKDDPLSHEFSVPDKLLELYEKRDFGDYAYNSDVPVAFISNNDITGGNSGSPVLNSKGELIGIAFDGNWEAMSGDIIYEPLLQRTISVDIRYVLFIIEKYGNAGYLLNEMKINN